MALSIFSSFSPISSATSSSMKFSRSPASSFIRLLSFRIFCAILLLWNVPVSGVVVPLNSGNLDTVINGAEVVFVNFYADWCRFSQMLTPVFEEASNKFNEPHRVVFASVDCDRQPDVAGKYHINKYPTLKLFRNGQPAKREYRGQRSAEAIVEFIQSQTKISMKDFATPQEIETKLDANKRNIIAYFKDKQGPEWENFVKTASSLREDCEFWIGFGEGVKDHVIGGNSVSFRPPRSTLADEVVFSGNLADAEYLRQWINDKCIPFVREITFENAEELTEEGLPFLILFRHPDDHTILETFTQEVARQLEDQKTAVNFLHADGKKFAHPLHHLGKGEADLPILAIDSFRHMYLFPNIKELTVPGKLRQFILDLHSGKLHREFHHGPDPTQQPPLPPAIVPGPDGQPMIVEQPSVPDSDQDRTSPPESTFKKLKPSHNRYTILRDEL